MKFAFHTRVASSDIWKKGTPHSENRTAKAKYIRFENSGGVEFGKLRFEKEPCIASRLVVFWSDVAIYRYNMKYTYRYDCVYIYQNYK